MPSAAEALIDSGDAIRFDWRSHPNHASESLLWRENEEVGAFELDRGIQVRGVGDILGQGMTCSRGRLVGLSVTVRGHDLSGQTLASRFPGLRGRSVDVGDDRYRWVRDRSDRWSWNREGTEQVLVAFQPSALGVRGGSSCEMLVARDVLQDPVTPYLIGFGWFMLIAPVGGIPHAILSLLSPFEGVGPRSIGERD